MLCLLKAEIKGVCYLPAPFSFIQSYIHSFKKQIFVEHLMRGCKSRDYCHISCSKGKSREKRRDTGMWLSIGPIRERWSSRKGHLMHNGGRTLENILEKVTEGKSFCNVFINIY